MDVKLLKSLSELWNAQFFMGFFDRIMDILLNAVK